MVCHERAIEEELGVLTSLADPSSDCLDLPSLVTHGVDSPRACTSHLLVSYVHAPANVYATCHRVTSLVFIIFAGTENLYLLRLCGVCFGLPHLLRHLTTYALHTLLFESFC